MTLDESVSALSRESTSESEVDYSGGVQEAYMYLRGYCRCDARRVVKGLVGAGYVERLQNEEPELYDLFRMGGL